MKKPDGTYDVFYMPSSIKRFDTLKVGDKITARYYETIVLRLKAPGEKDNNTATGGVVRSPNQPSGTASQQQTVTVTITAIDPKLPSITFTGPRGWTYSSRVEDTKALGQGEGRRSRRHHLDRSARHVGRGQQVAARGPWARSCDSQSTWRAVATRAGKAGAGGRRRSGERS